MKGKRLPGIPAKGTKPLKKAPKEKESEEGKCFFVSFSFIITDGVSVVVFLQCCGVPCGGVIVYSVVL